MSEQPEVQENAKGINRLSTPMITAISAIVLALIGLLGRYIDKQNIATPDCDNTVIVRELSKTVVKQSDEIATKNNTIEHLKTVVEEQNHQLWDANRDVKRKVVNPLKRTNHER